MKKVLSFILTLTLGFSSFMPSVQAKTENPLTFFESIDNLNSLKSYKAAEAIYGNFEVEDPFGSFEKINGSYRISFNTKAKNDKPYETDAETTVQGRLTMGMTGEDAPFNELIVRFRGQMKHFMNEGIYMKLDSLTVNATGVPQEELDDYNEFQAELTEGLKEVRGKWHFIDLSALNDLNAELTPGFEEAFNQEEILANLRKKGLKGAYQEILDIYLEEAISTGELTKEEARQMEKISNEILNSNLFTIKEIKRGQNKGLTHFSFSKRRFISLMSKIAKVFGEEASRADLLEISQMLRKFHLSGMYRINDEHRIHDFFRIKFSLKDIEMLKNFSFNYSQKITKINEKQIITKPRNATNLEDLMAPFLPTSQPSEFNFDEEFDFDNEFEFDFDEPAEFPVFPTETNTSVIEVSEDNDPVLGDQNAPVTIVEFSDYECPFCARFHLNTLPKLMEEYIDKGKAKLVFRDFPLAFHPHAFEAAHAAECVRELSGDSAYFEMHDKIFENQSDLSSANIELWAKELVRRDHHYDECVFENRYEEEIKKDIADAESYGVTGTPTFFINGKVLNGAQPFESFKQIIEEELAN